MNLLDLFILLKLLFLTRTISDHSMSLSTKVIETTGHCCMLHVLLKSFKSFKVTHFHRERKILMRKRRKLMKKTIHDSKISETLIT